MDPVREHLRLLSIFHYVVGGIGYLISLFPVIHLVVGLFFLFAPGEIFQTPVPAAESSEGGAAPPVHSFDPFPARLFGGVFVAVASVIILLGFLSSTLIVVAGKRLAAHRSHTYCLVVAGIECLFAPLGTVLGVFTILTLLKPEAKRLFGLPPVDGDHVEDAGIPTSKG